MVNIEIDGIPLKVDSTKMIIQAADDAGIDIPRFCYHKKLSVAANCRMCLVDVDKSRKALPACATPVSEGMKVFTQSKNALDAQRGVMEFLLINHPLDCPICDQGGECELQDLSMGYGAGISRFNEKKRVVQDKNIGALIKTDMTRCIHCTRCVRFGQEIAGIQELGATGRGEHMEIGTYIEHSMQSELSGNIIDICPVGALTSKPFRYRARAWELSAHSSIAPHDAIGSNIEFHTKRNDVMRVVPRENESVNETWISDRDRFSYLGLNHEQRATTPLIKENGQWQTTDWQTALNKVVEGLQQTIEHHGAEQIAGVISPTASMEEAYLLQKWLRALGTHNIDHRLRQQDFADERTRYNQADWLLSDIANNDAIVLVGCNVRSEQPILSQRIRQAALSGTTVSEINFFTSDLLMPVDKQLSVNSEQLLQHLMGVAKAVLHTAVDEHPKWEKLLADTEPTASEQTIAMQLANAAKATVFVGALANNHPQASQIRTLCSLITELTHTNLIVLPTANSTALQLSGALPFTLDAGDESQQGLNIQQCWQNQLHSYVLMGLEPELDCDNPAQVRKALTQADFVVSLSSFVTDTLYDYADVILPIATFAETSGTFVGVDKQWQSYKGAVAAKGESRPGWKVLRVLANLSNVAGFDYVSSEDIVAEIKQTIKMASEPKTLPYIPTELRFESAKLTAVAEVPMYYCDSIVRRSDALLQTDAGQSANIARINSSEAEKLGLQNAKRIKITDGECDVVLALAIDNQVANGCLYMPVGIDETSHFGAGFTDVSVVAAAEGD